MRHPSSSFAVARKHQGFALLPRVAMEHHAHLGKAAGGHSSTASINFLRDSVRAFPRRLVPGGIMGH
jgi:hypothetical protein